MINSKKELSFYLKADRMMNRGTFVYSFKYRLIHWIYPDYIMSYLEAMRKYSYYRHVNSMLKYYYYYKYKKLGLKLGFSIGYDVFGYGLVIPHYGTIVVGNSNKIGNYAVLHTSTCISDNGKKIGDGLYCSTGVKITKKIILGNNCSIGANSLVNKDFQEDGILLGGIPANFIRKSDAWYVRDGQAYINKVNSVEKLKSIMDL